MILHHHAQPTATRPLVRSQLSAACEDLLPSFLSSTPAPCRDQHLNEKQWGNHMLGNMENGRETRSSRPVSNVWLWLDYCPKIAPTATDKVAIVCCWWGEYLLTICILILGECVFSCPQFSNTHFAVSCCFSFVVLVGCGFCIVKHGQHVCTVAVCSRAVMQSWCNSSPLMGIMPHNPLTIP